MNKILVVAAHPDDEVLGVGGTIAMHAKNGSECHALILGEGITARGERRELFDGREQVELQEEARKSARILGYESITFCGLPDVRFDGLELLDIVKMVQKAFAEFNPDQVYTHHYGDLNIDHRLTYEATLCACRPAQKGYPRELFCFETLSSTEWNFGRRNHAFFPNTFVDISQTMETKIDAMKCYVGEVRPYPHPRSLESIRALAMVRGSTINTEYAEAFEQVLRIL